MPEEEMNLNPQIVNISKTNAENRNTKMRCKALFMLSLIAILLILLGYETSFNISLNSDEGWYNAVGITYLLGTLISFFGNNLFSKWNRTAIMVIVVISFLSVLLYLDVAIPFYDSISKYYPITIVFLVTLPVLAEIFTRWLFSSVYSGYLRNYVLKVKNDYKCAMDALQNNDKKHMPRIYKKLINESIYTSDSNKTLSDICIQGYVDIRNSKLNKISRYPNGFYIFASWICYKCKRLWRTFWGLFILKSKVSVAKEPYVYKEKADNNQNVVLNYQREYDEYLVERSKEQGPLSIKQFCQRHNYDASAMITWLKQKRSKYNS